MGNFIKDNKILLLQRHNTGYEDGKFSIVAGHVEHGESAKLASIREIREELGIIVNYNSLQFIGVMHRKSTEERVDFFLLADDWIGEPSISEPDKCSLLFWADMNDLPSNTIPYIKFAIENFKMYSSLPWITEFGW